MYRNYIFDLYGTLVDIRTNESKDSVWRKLAMVMNMQGAAYEVQELKNAYQWEVENLESQSLVLARQTLGESVAGAELEICLDEVFRRLYARKGVEAPGQQLADLGVFFRALTLEKLTLFPGAEELLERLHQAGAGVYLLSNAQRIFTEPEMRLLGIYDKFDGILYSSDAGWKKPSWRFYQTLMERFGLEKEKTVMVGNDWQADAWGASHFGMDSIYVHTEQSTELTGNLPENCRRILHIGQVFPE